jgi:MFS family permease
MMTSLCSEYYQFVLAQGVLGGFACGMSLAPCLAIIGHYFQKNRAAAMGAAVGGSSIGSVIFPIMFDKLLPNPRLGFPWTMRICGFLMVAILGPACIVIRARLPPRKGQFLLPAAFKELPYVTLIAASFMMMLGIFIPTFYLPSFAISNGMSADLALYLIAIYNGASFFGRVIPGILADKFGRFNIYFGAALSSAILGFCWQRADSNAAIIIFAVIYGFCSGAIVSTMSVCMTMVSKDPKNIGTYMGMAWPILAIAALIGPPISGAILTRAGYNGIANFSGAVTLVGSVLIVLTKYTTGKGVVSKF